MALWEDIGDFLILELIWLGPGPDLAQTIHSILMSRREQKYGVRGIPLKYIH